MLETTLLPRLLQLLGILFLVANLRLAVDFIRFFRMRSSALLTWPGRRPPYYGLGLAMAIVLGLLVFVKLVKQQRPVLDVFGVPAPSGDDALSGKTLLPEWAGETPAARDVFIDMPAGPYNGDRQAFISGDWKMITSNSRPVGLYDLAKDPGETNNLVKDAALSEQHLERMKAFRSKLRVVKVKPQ